MTTHENAYTASVDDSIICTGLSEITRIFGPRPRDVVKAAGASIGLRDVEEIAYVDLSHSDLPPLPLIGWRECVLAATGLDIGIKTRYSMAQVRGHYPTTTAVLKNLWGGALGARVFDEPAGGTPRAIAEAVRRRFREEQSGLVYFKASWATSQPPQAR